MAHKLFIQMEHGDSDKRVGGTIGARKFAASCTQVFHAFAKVLAPLGQHCVHRFVQTQVIEPLVAMTALGERCSGPLR